MKMGIGVKLKILRYICTINLFTMRKTLLSIGTNTNANFNVKHALDCLLAYFPTIQFTEIIETKPFGIQYKGPFLNALGYFETAMSKDELINCFKTIEKEMGRQPSDKAEGKVIIDIDLIQLDDEVLKPEEFKREYMHDLLKQVQDIMGKE